jgi:uncharacterized protein
MRRHWTTVAGAGAAVGVLGGLIGLGGAEFRLPILLGVFAFAPLEAVILNKAVSLVVVASALPLRGGAVPLADVVAQWPVILNLLAGSLLGAWMAAGWAVRMSSVRLARVIAVLLVAIAALLVLPHDLAEPGVPLVEGTALFVLGTLAGLGIGVVAALLGVAGGELLIPTLVVLFAVPIKLAGSVSLAVSLPTMLMGFARYSQDQSFVVVRANQRFLLVMAAGSVVGTFLGGRLVAVVPSEVLLPLLAIILVVSGVRLWRH